MPMKLTAWLILLFSVVGYCYSLSTQSVWVKGKLKCGNRDAKNIRVELVDVDLAPNPDDLLDSGYTNATGEFDLKGSSSEFSDIDPEIRIYHDCNDLGIPCERKWVIRIPKKYIYDGTVAQQPMNVGILNLELELEHEIHHCFES